MGRKRTLSEPEIDGRVGAIFLATEAKDALSASRESFPAFVHDSDLDWASALAQATFPATGAPHGVAGQVDKPKLGTVPDCGAVGTKNPAVKAIVVY